MRGVFVVRFLAFLAILSICSGFVFLESESNLAEPVEEDSASSEPLTESEENTESDDSAQNDELALYKPENSKFEDQKDQNPADNTLSYIFLGLGGGFFSSLVFGSFIFEFIRVLFLLAFLTPMIATKDKKDERTRGRILGFVEGYSGIHFSALRDGLGLANGVTAYHLRVLEMEEAIISWRDGRLRRYAIATISPNEIDLIRHPLVGTRLAILEILHQSQSLGLTGKEIQKQLDISRQLLSHHMNALRNSKYVEKEGPSRKSTWKLSLDGLEQLEIIRNKINIS